MLIEIYSTAFKENNSVRPPIKFHEGLNVILGTQSASNSIGKSSALLVIDFVFGGDTYLYSDAIRNIGNHTIYFCFQFDKKYYFGRNTNSPDNISICNSDYLETSTTMSKKEFLNFLMDNYIHNENNLTFRQLVSTYFRIYGKDNRDENFPLQGYRNQSKKESIKILMNLLDYYKDIEPFQARFDLEEDKLKTFKNARKYSFISNLIGGTKQYEDNINKISTLKAELDSLTYDTVDEITQEDIEQSKHREYLKSNKFNLEIQLERVSRRSKLLDFSIETGLTPTEADLNALQNFSLM